MVPDTTPNPTCKWLRLCHLCIHHRPMWLKINDAIKKYIAIKCRAVDGVRSTCLAVMCVSQMAWPFQATMQLQKSFRICVEVISRLERGICCKLFVLVSAFQSSVLYSSLAWPLAILLWTADTQRLISTHASIANAEQIQLTGTDYIKRILVWAHVHKVAIWWGHIRWPHVQLT